MDSEIKIKVKSNDGKVEVELSSKAALRSGILKGVIEDYPDNPECVLNEVDGVTLEKVKEYLIHYENEEPPIVQKPFKSNNFKECASEWDYNFLGDDNNSILALIRAANFMDIKPLLELASAKLASKIRGTTTESIRKDFGITNFNKDEEEQIEKDKEYLEKNL